MEQLEEEINEEALVSEVGKLIVKVNKLNKKPSLESDLSGVLELFEKQMDDNERFMENGIVVTNFGEVALFVQSSAVLWCKKVDLLWDFTIDLHKRLITYDYEHAGKKGPNVEMEKLEEKEKKFTRKRRKRIKKPEDPIELHHLSVLQVYRYSKVFNAEQSYEFHTEPLKTWAAFNESVHEDPPPPPDLNVPMLRDFYQRTEDVLPVIIEDVEDGEFVARLTKCPGLQFYDYLFKLYEFNYLMDLDGTVSTLRIKLIIKHLFCFHNNIRLDEVDSKYKQELEEFNMDYMKQLSHDMSKRPDPHAPYLLKVAPNMKLKFRRISAAEARVLVPELDEDTINELRFEILNGSKKLVIRLSQLSQEVMGEFQEAVSMNGDDSFDEHEEVFIEPQRRKRKAVITEEPKKKKAKLNSDGFVQMSKKLSRQQINKLLIPKLSVKLDSFEVFFSMNYKSSKGEGEVPEFICDEPENDSGFEEPTLGCDSILDPELSEMEQLRENVDSWHSFIRPVLRNLEENDFDIHEYGSNIINSLEINETKLFKDIIQKKTTKEVVRHFISALQLANTNNIEISGAVPNKVANDTFAVTLLTKERYHENLGTYLAPSEASFKSRLVKATSTPVKKRNRMMEYFEVECESKKSRISEF